MSGGVFLRRGERLVEMIEESYALEDHLQELIERHPNLLAGDQVNPDSPRRWLMLSREVAVPGEEGGAGRWSLDHLLLDQDAIPTLIEVKRSSDSRIRREVVGQMLDYARTQSGTGISTHCGNRMRRAFALSAKTRRVRSQRSPMIPRRTMASTWSGPRRISSLDVFASSSLRTWFPPSFNVWSTSSTNACPRPRRSRSRSVKTREAVNRCSSPTLN